MSQNTSHAVMAQRVEPADSLDDFPTPPWATRALLTHIINNENLSDLSCLEPACNRGFMSEPLKEFFKTVHSSDIFEYGYGERADFLNRDYKEEQFDWVITNPPFKLGEDFVFESLRVAKRGVAILARTVFLESVGRYDRLFSKNPPSKFAQFVERVPMVKGRLDKSASTATGYSWFVWEKFSEDKTNLLWVPPCRKKLEKDDDYIEPKDRKNLTEGKQGSLFD